MPDRHGRFLGISVPELPWKREKKQEKEAPAAAERARSRIGDGRVVEKSGRPRAERR